MPDEIQEKIDELTDLPSDRPSVEIKFTDSLRPKTPKGFISIITSTLLALGAIAEVIHQLLTK